MAYSGWAGAGSFSFDTGAPSVCGAACGIAAGLTGSVDNTRDDFIKDRERLEDSTASVMHVNIKSTAHTAVAFIRKFEAEVPNIVCVEFAPNISLRPEPRPACIKITKISTKLAITCITITKEYSIF
jgi:hypothetical protein